MKKHINAQKMPEYGVILLNLGGPESIKSVEKFIYNLFSDPDIFKFPFSRVTQKFFAKMISKIRARKVTRYYKQIGGRSPIISYTFIQARLLEKKLERLLDCKLYIGFRYWHPSIDEALERALKDNVDKIILLPLFPQYSTATTGSSFREFYRTLERLNISPRGIIEIRSYPDNPLYIKAVSEKIEEAITNFKPEELKSFALVFSAHSLPVKFIENGDPYLEETQKTYSVVLKYLRENSKRKNIYENVRTELCFQSKIGPVKWLEPSTIETIKKLAKEKIKNLLIVPLSFVSDNLETLYELGILAKDIALENGIEKFIVAEALNDSETFVDALKSIVLEAIENHKQSQIQR